MIVSDELGGMWKETFCPTLNYCSDWGQAWDTLWPKFKPELAE
jgi:hypothetical protein